MDIDDEVTNTEPADNETPTVEPTALRRSSTKRIVGGVASGIGERFDIDANIVRAVFVVLACLYGFGAAIYLILWVLVPRAGESDVTSEELVLTEQEEKRSSRWRAIVLIAGALCLGLIFILVYTNRPAWGSGIGTAWLIFLVVIAVLSLRGPRRRFTLGRLISGFFLVVVSLLILASGGFLGFVAMTGVPISGGIGDNVYAPTTITQVKPVYRTAFGSMTVDLRQVSFNGQTISVTASVAAGILTIEVPPGVVVDVTAHSGAQQINYPQGYGNFYVAPKTGTHQAILRLHASVGVGDIQLIRSTPGSQLFNN
jgi:phage shock protein PspC (stress-responsive transcriptional regulator)